MLFREKELEMYLQEASTDRVASKSSQPPAIHNRGMMTIPYYHAPRAARLNAILAELTFDDEYINAEDCFSVRNTPRVELIENAFESYPLSSVDAKRATSGALKGGEKSSGGSLAANSPMKGAGEGKKAVGVTATSLRLKRQVDDTVGTTRNKRLLTSVSNHQVEHPYLTRRGLPSNKLCIKGGE